MFEDNIISIWHLVDFMYRNDIRVPYISEYSDLIVSYCRGASNVKETKRSSLLLSDGDGIIFVKMNVVKALIGTPWGTFLDRR